MFWYVDPTNGDDSEQIDPGSEVHPFLTVDKALSEAKPGDTIYLRGGYYKPLSAFIAGEPAKRIMICSYPGEEAIFDASFPEFREVPNDLWEGVPGQDSEWRTKKEFEFPPEKEKEVVFWGQLIDRKVRLLTYNRIEDLRATNESWLRVNRHVDTRPSGGPLAKDVDMQVPWTYFGPGIYWNSESKKVHIRLAATHIGAEGVEEYPGSENPNHLRIALSCLRETFAANITAQHVEFRHITFQNGGDVTLRINGKCLPDTEPVAPAVSATTKDVLFDHVRVYGARRGVRIGTCTTDVTFRNCLFDGGVAPWTTRTELKESYTFVDQALGKCVSTGTGAVTSEELFLTDYEVGLHIHHCEFRNCHDGISLWGRDIDFHHNVLEELNDEGITLGGSPHSRDVRVYQNLIRQTLHPFSMALAKASGPNYIYRNLIIQKDPTRRGRILPPDAPEPNIFSWGNDVKMNNEVGPVYYFQNTFVVRVDDGAQAYSAIFSNADLGSPHERHFFNNIHVVVCSSPNNHMWIPHPAFPAQSDGNLYYNYGDGPAPMFRHPAYDGVPPGSIEDIDALRVHDIFTRFQAVNGVGWEATSLEEDPAFRAFSETCYGYPAPDPHMDMRPAVDSPARGAGIVLPDILRALDPLAPTDDTRPDIGALPIDSAIFTVGIDGRIQLPT